MAFTLSDVLLIPYGTAEIAPDEIAVEGLTTRSLRLRAPFPCAAVNRLARQPLRLNNSRYDLGLAPDLQAVAGDRAAVVRVYLKGLCRPWDNLATGFLDAYFAFVADVIEQNAGDLAERLAPYAGLYDYRDWLFSAPKPLPRAHLYAPPATGAEGDASDFIRVDFAFWLGDRLVAAQSAGSALTPKKAKEQADRLRLAGIEVIPFGSVDIAGDKARDLFARILGPRLPFWESDMLPAGPFRTALLDD